MSRSAKVNQVILIIFDDVRAEHLFHWMNEGKLPHIAQLAEKGISSQACITSFPSVTLPCYSDIITGSNSGYFPKEGSGVPNYHWLDRADPPIEKRKPPFIRNYSERKHLLKINKDVGSHAKTIFEQADDGNFLSATSFFYRGSTFTTPTEYRPELILKKMEEVFKNPRDVFSNQEIPRISVGYIPHTDSLMHERGFDHPDYINLVLNCDKFIGSLIETLHDIGHMEDTAICVTADHGNYKASKFYDLEPIFQSKGLKPYSPSTGNGNFDANLGGVGFFNFRGDTWFHHPSITQMKNYTISKVGIPKLNLFEELWNIPGTKLMYYKEDGNTADKGMIHLERSNRDTGKKQKGRIEYIGTGRDQKTKYTFENEDLFGYAKHEKASTLLDNKFHDINEWVACTFQTDFINVIDQLPRHFKNPRACDIMISTEGEYSFNYEHGSTTGNSLYSHDICNPKSMFVPLIIGSSPQIPKIEVEWCKTTDIVPTLLDFLGLKPNSSVIGRSLLNNR